MNLIDLILLTIKMELLSKGAIVLLALSILTPYFRYIPKSTLAAVLIVAVIFMVSIFHLYVFMSSPAISDLI